MERKNILKDEIWNLHRKADQTRSMHHAIGNKLSFWNIVILGFVTVGTAIVSMLIFADLKKEIQFWVGTFSALIFIASLIPNTFSFESKILRRKQAANLWGEWIRTASNFCNTEIDTLEQDKAITEQKRIVENYKQIMKETPSIPDRLFNKLKQKHLQKIEISKALDKNPFEKIANIAKELKGK
ncbi:MAG: hypothetical protein ACEPOV_11280 [Hyphomicrobiales bacterium]